MLIIFSFIVAIYAFLMFFRFLFEGVVLLLRVGAYCLGLGINIWQRRSAERRRRVGIPRPKSGPPPSPTPPDSPGDEVWTYDDQTQEWTRV